MRIKASEPLGTSDVGLIRRIALSFATQLTRFAEKSVKPSAPKTVLHPFSTNQLVDEICEAAKIEADNRSELISKGSNPIYAQGWLTARRWEDEQGQNNNSNDQELIEKIYGDDNEQQE